MQLFTNPEPCHCVRVYSLSRIIWCLLMHAQNRHLIGYLSYQADTKVDIEKDCSVSLGLKCFLFLLWINWQLFHCSITLTVFFFSAEKSPLCPLLPNVTSWHGQAVRERDSVRESERESCIAAAGVPLLSTASMSAFLLLNSRLHV